MATSSLFLWHFVILPNLSSPHSFPDYQDLCRRLPSFPYYWTVHTNNLILQERLKIQTYDEDCDSEISVEEWTLLQKVLKKRKQSPTIPKPIEEVQQEEDQGDCSGVDSTCDAESKTKDNLLRNPERTKLMAEILEKSNPIDFANAGFFYSHPRMQGLQVGLIFWIV